MKTNLFTIALLFFVLVFTACNSDNNPVVTPIATPSANGFSWKENGGSIVKTATSATFSTQYKTLIARDASGATVFEINLNGTVPATYTIGSNNAITYVGVSPYFTASSGNIVISANAAGKVTGTFQGDGNSGGITAVNGTFTNIDVVP